MSDKEVNENAIIETTFGSIEVEFFPGTAPNHVKNFKKLAADGFYDKTYFHRVIPGFMIQGGDPNTKDGDRSRDGTGGSEKNLKAEFSDINHERGILSMARSTDPDSASSQFFIMVADSSHLNGQYSAFGKVIKGLDVVDKIVNVDRDERDNPIENIFIESISFKNA